MSIKWMIKKSDAVQIIQKSIGKDKLEALKKEVIEILQKKEEKDFKKAVEYFAQDEARYSHLEKSISGGWIEKAGYGVGTVRIWKGKKYKKVSASPTRWVRVFDKNDRGAASSMGKYIAQVKRCQSAEELYQFCMKQRSLFQDENGVDLPIMDKLRAAIDEQNGKIERGEVNKPDTNNAEQKKYDRLLKEFKNEIATGKRNNTKELKEDVQEWKNLVAGEMSYRKEHNGENGGLSDAHIKHIQNCIKVGEEELQRRQEKKDSKVLSNGKTVKEVRKKYGIKTDDNKAYKGKLATQKQIDEATKIAEKTELNRDEMLKKPITRIQQYANSNVDDFDGGIDKFIEYKAEIQSEGVSMDEVGKEFAKLINHNVARKIWDDYKNGALIINEDGYFESKKDSDSKTYWIQDKGNNRITNEDAKNRIKSNLSQIDAYNNLIADSDKADSIKWNSKKDQLENENKNLMDKMNPEDRKEMESEAEKHQNRSNAMKGNQNAKKYGLNDNQIEYYHIKDVLDSKHEGFGIVVNDEGKYSYVFDKRVYDYPEDFTDDKSKVENRIENSYQTNQNYKEAKEFDFKNLKIADDVTYTGNYDGKHTYVKLSPDKKRALKVEVRINDMREPLEMIYSVRDGNKIWEYETAYGNKDHLEWAVEHPSEMKKEMQKFFKRDVDKEWNRMDSNTNVSINPYEPAEYTDPDSMNPISTNKSIGENKVELPYSKELSNEIKGLENSVSTDITRPFMNEVYYSQGNLVGTDGMRLKIVKVGKLDGIPENTFVKIDNSKAGITIEADTEKKDQFPDYNRIIPKNLDQKISLDNKILKEKLKTLKDEGGWDNKNPMITFEVKDSNLMLDGVKVGDAKNVVFDDERENNDFFNMNANNLLNALSGDKSNLMCSHNSLKAMTISTNSTENILMPMSKTYQETDSNGHWSEKVNRRDFDSGKKAKKEESERKSKEKALRIDSLDTAIEGFKKQLTEEKVNKLIGTIHDKNNPDHESIIRHSYDAMIKAEKQLKNPSNKYLDELSNPYGLRLIASYRINPEFRTALIDAAKDYGMEIKKSLFDFLELDDSDEDNFDYSDNDASQPELFNSTQYKVADALNSVFGC